MSGLHWDSWSAFFHMGGYGAYVWGSLGVFAAGLLAEAWGLRQRRQAVIRTLRWQREARALAGDKP